MMVKEQRVPGSEIKNVRTFGGDIEMVVSELKERPVPMAKMVPLVPFVTRKGKDLSPEAWAVLQAAAEAEKAKK